MAMEELFINGAGDYKIRLFFYKTDAEKVTGSVLLLHGMAEHHERYELFIHKLNEVGMDVYTYDHRGHGMALKDDDLGFFAESNGSELVIEDAVSAIKAVSAMKRSEKYAIFGHSMGSIITRNVIQRFDQMDCAIICGTAYEKVGKCRAGLFAAGIVKFFCGPRHKSKFLDKAMFGGKAYTSVCTRTPFDWLTKDEKIVDQYIEDPYCGFLCTSSFYYDLTELTMKATKGIKKTRVNLPILLASGKADPVGGCGNAVNELYGQYKGLGYKDVTMKLYDNDRHEILNETDKEVVMKDFIDYLTKYLQED